MKKWLLMIGLAIVVIVGVQAIRMYESKAYYPELPIESLSKKEVVEKVKGSEEKFIKLTNEDGYEWYISKELHTGKVDAMVESLVGRYGWKYDEKLGNTTFYKKDNKVLAVKSVQWTSNYKLINIEETYNE